MTILRRKTSAICFRLSFFTVPSSKLCGRLRVPLTLFFFFKFLSQWEPVLEKIPSSSLCALTVGTLTIHCYEDPREYPHERSYRFHQTYEGRRCTEKVLDNFQNSWLFSSSRMFTLVDTYMRLTKMNLTKNWDMPSISCSCNTETGTNICVFRQRNARQTSPKPTSISHSFRRKLWCSRAFQLTFQNSETRSADEQGLVRSPRSNRCVNVVQKVFAIFLSQ